MTKAARKTPVRSALREDSKLQVCVANGLGALQEGHRNYVDAVVRPDFADSLDMDAAMIRGHEQANRWDYLLGHTPSDHVIAVEPHSAKQDEITTIIRKRTSALEQLKGHLRDGARVTKWLWVASGRVQFADTERARRRLDENGIEFVGTKVMAKHLPPAAMSSPKQLKRPKGKR